MDIVVHVSHRLRNIICFVGPKENGEKPMTNISNMFLQMCLVSPPEVDVCSEEKTAVFLSPFFLPTSPETQTIKLKVRQTRRLEVIDKVKSFGLLYKPLN
jgi:hypothetical protein